MRYWNGFIGLCLSQFGLDAPMSLRTWSECLTRFLQKMIGMNSAFIRFYGKQRGRR
jgi:hypothetical protein